MATKGDTAYYMTVENGDYSIVLKSIGSGGWEVYKRDRKNPS